MGHRLKTIFFDYVLPVAAVAMILLTTAMVTKTPKPAMCIAMDTRRCS